MDTGVTIALDALIRLKAEAHGFSLLPRQPVTSMLAGRHASRLRGRGLEFEELRQYAPGDDVRNIDWRATARLRSPHVRVYAEERERPVLLVVDQRRTMFFGSRRAMKSVAAAEVAALAAWRAVASGDRIGGVVFGDNELIEVRPHRSESRALRVLGEVMRLNQHLADAPATGATVALNDALSAATRLARHDHLVVLISDLDGADDETKRLATLLAAHNDVLVIGIYDPLGASLRGRSGMIASDRGATYAIPAGAAFADAFRRAFAVRIEHWRDVFLALQVPVIPVSAAIPPAQQLRTLFGAHRAVR
jgi:uncharacterized protein (DUF58 family)